MDMMTQAAQAVEDSETIDESSTDSAPEWQPPTREQAIAELIARDIAQHGEDEREASTERRSRLCHALALNALAYYDTDSIDDRLAVEARRALLRAERATGKRA